MQIEAVIHQVIQIVDFKLSTQPESLKIATTQNDKNKDATLVKRLLLYNLALISILLILRYSTARTFLIIALSDFHPQSTVGQIYLESLANSNLLCGLPHQPSPRSYLEEMVCKIRFSSKFLTQISKPEYPSVMHLKSLFSTVS